MAAYATYTLNPCYHRVSSSAYTFLIVTHLMEQSCYKCGRVIEEGRPFCPHCSAPQIRVVISEPIAAAPLAEVAAVPQLPAALPASQTVPVLAVPMHWSHAVRPCALAAFVGSLLMTLGLHPLVAMLVVGFLAVVFYRQGRPGVSLTTGAGAKLGALSGLLWFAMSSILEAGVVLVLHKGAEIRQSLLTSIDQFASRTSDPQALAVFDRFKTPDGIEFLMVAGLIVGFLASVALGALGGALGGSVLGRRHQN